MTAPDKEELKKKAEESPEEMTSAEIAFYMEYTFEDALTEGMERAFENKEEEDE